VEIVDDYTLNFHFTKELTDVGEFQQIFCKCFIFSEKAFADSPTEFASDLVGTGPYKISGYVPGVSLTLEARDDYWQTDESKRAQLQQANVKTIVYNMISEEAQTIIGLQTGDIDISSDISQSNLSQFEGNDKYSVASFKNNAVYFLAPNCAPDSACSDLNMRLALFYALDLDGVAAALGKGAAQRLYAFASDLFGDYQKEWETWENYNTTFDADKAKEYLAKTSYNGEALRLITVSACSTAAQVMVQMWSNVGIKVDIQTLEMGTLNATETDPTAWDLEMSARGSSDYNVSLWSHFFDTSNTATGLTTNNIDDPELYSIMCLSLTVDGHTAANETAWWQRCSDNAYIMGLYSLYRNIVHSNQFTHIVMTEKNEIMVGACTFSA